MSNKDKEKTKSGEETYTQKAQKTVDTFTTMQNKQADGQIALAEKDAATSIERAERDTNKQIDQTNADYLDIINTADIQKELDIRNIRETRANMGLSRSGISSTEQTAAILSAGNKTAAAQRQRQAAIDTLQQSLLDYKGDVDSKLAATKLDITQTRDNNIFSFADTKLSQAEQMDLDVAQTKETNRQNGLATLLQNGTINYDVYSQAMGDTGITVEAAKQMGDAARIAEINNSNLPDDVKQLALTQGWWLKDAVAYHEQQKGTAETERKNMVTQYQTAGLIDLTTANKAIAEGWTAEQIQAHIDTTTQAAKAQQNATLDSLKSKGYISAEICQLAKDMGWDANTAIAYQQEVNSKAASDDNTENPYRHELDKLYGDGTTDAISHTTYGYATNPAHYLNGQQALAYEANLKLLYEAYEKGEIDKETYEYAKENWIDADVVLDLKKREETINGYIETAKNFIYHSTRTVTLANGRVRTVGIADKSEAINYLASLVGLTEEEFDFCCSKLGITEKDVEEYRNQYKGQNNSYATTNSNANTTNYTTTTLVESTAPTGRSGTTPTTNYR